MSFHAASGQHISVPPERKSQSTWGFDVPQGLKAEVQNVVKNIYGDNPNITIESFRMCWYVNYPVTLLVFSSNPERSIFDRKVRDVKC